MEEDGDGGEDSEEQKCKLHNHQTLVGLTLLLIFKVEKSLVTLKQTDEMFTKTLKKLSNQLLSKHAMLNYKVNLKHFIIDNQKIHDDMIRWTDEQNNATKDYIARNPDYKTKSKYNAGVFHYHITHSIYLNTQIQSLISSKMQKGGKLSCQRIRV